MKLRNKKTGKIIDIANLDFKSDNFAIWLSTTRYSSLAELIEEWEDYEGPKEWWFIDCTGSIKHGEGLFTEKSYIEDIQKIGNYFESREEAEKAVEKLKAWKRLKDKGFKFVFTPGVGALDVEPGKFQIDIMADMPSKWWWNDKIVDDIDFIFGGEDE